MITIFNFFFVAFCLFGINEDEMIKISIKNMMNEKEITLTAEESYYVYNMIQASKKKRFGKCFCKYQITLIEGNKSMIYKTNGISFSKKGTNLYSDFAHDITYFLNQLE